MPRTVRIAFLGNCYIFGYRGVPARDTFPEIARRRIEAERPGVRIEVVRTPVYHPADLPRQVARVLVKHSPDVVIIDAPASPLAFAGGKPRVSAQGLPRGAARLIDGVQKGFSLLRAFSAEHRVVRPAFKAMERMSHAVVDRKIVPVQRHTPPTFEDYERCLEEAIGLVSAQSTTRLIVQGPSGFNIDESHHVYKPGTLDLYRDVNAMVKRVTVTHDVTMIDRQHVVDGANPDMFLGKTVRMSAAGHLATGHALASTILDTHIL
jgi:hypothetical protein